MALKVVVIPASSRQEVIDEFGDLSRRVEDFAPVALRHKKLKDQIRSWYDSHPADATATADGLRYTIHVGTREWQRTIESMEGLFNLLGLKKFLKACTFPISQIDRLITAKQRDSVLTKSQSGLRSIKAVQKT